MNYQEFRKAYSWTLKKYPGTFELFCGDFESFKIGSVKETIYTKSGRGWKKVTEYTKDVTPAYYFNTVDAVPFFRNLGGRETVEVGYCVRGYVPLKVSSISPDRDKKIVREFKLF